MSEESINSSDPKAKFREVLEKKKSAGGVRKNNLAGNSKVNGGGQTSGNAQKMFRRKSGST